MNAPISTKKRCTGCLEYKLPTLENFEPHHGGLRSRCRDCRRDASRNRDARRRFRGRTGSDPDYIPGPKPCALCCDLPWRITGLRCPLCKLEVAQEPKPELVLRRFDRVWT